MSEVIVVARFAPHPRHVEEVLEALRAAVPAVHDEPGCLLYTVNREEDDTIVMIEKWSSRDALEAHNRGPALAALQGSLEGLLVGDGTLSLSSAVPMGSEDKGAL